MTTTVTTIEEVTTITVATAGPQGPKGDIGPVAVGPPGPQGDPGRAFTLRGAVATSGDLPPSDNQAADAFITTDTGHLFVWNGADWIDGGAIRGPQGIQGIQGIAGRSFLLRGTVPSAGDLPSVGNEVGNAFVTVDAGHLYAWDGATWIDGGLIRGPEGQIGLKGDPGPALNFRGSVASSSGLPTTDNAAGDAFIAEDTDHLWVWTASGSWLDLGPLGSSTPGIDVQEFVTPGNHSWIKPAGARYIKVFIIGAGGGGGGGARTTLGVMASGGGGGGAGIAKWFEFEASQVGGLQPVTVGLGGSGGGGASVVNTNGSAGGGGGASSFATVVAHGGGGGGPGGYNANSGGGGAAGSYSAGGTGNTGGGTGGPQPPVLGGSGGANGGVATAYGQGSGGGGCNGGASGSGGVAFFGPSGGGAGGGLTISAAGIAGQPGRVSDRSSFGPPKTTLHGFGMGGAGGAANLSGGASPGENSERGGGGGGGGAAIDGNGGNGGNGGDGYVRVTTYF